MRLGDPTRLDYRTRFVGRVRDVDAEAFFDDELPRALERHGTLAADAARRLTLPALALDVAGRAWTLLPRERTLEIQRGRERAGTVVALDERAFSELVEEEKSALGLVFAGRARVEAGASEAFIAWDAVLRAALDGRALHRPGSVVFEGLEPGTALDLGRGFQPDDDPREMRHFVEQAGHLHLRAVFTASEMEAVAAEMDAAAAGDVGDGTWWAETRSRGRIPVRLLEFQERSATLRDLLADPRFTRIGARLGMGHAPGDTFGEHLGRVSAEALFKPDDVVEGLADLPWHKDCARGGHSRHCCGLTAGIAVTGSGPTLGRLRVIAGSHRASLPGLGVPPGLELPEVALDVEAGDVTLHSSCTLHMSTPPTRGERRVVYCGFSLPPRPGDARAPEDEARARRERAAVSRHAREATRAGWTRPRR